MKILVLHSENIFLQTLAELAWRYSSQVAVNRHVVFLEIAKSRKIYSADEIIKKIQQACQELHIPLKWAFGKSQAEAWAFLNYNTENKKALPLEALQIYLDPFQRTEVSPKIPEMIQTFYKLGYKNFFDLDKIPRAGVPSRFGAAGLWALQKAEDLSEPAWPLWKPAEVIIETQSFDPDQRVQNIEALNFILRPSLERLLARLLWRHEALTQLELTLYLEHFSVVKNPVRRWEFSFSFPQTKSLSVMQILKEKLDFDLQKNPLESSVILFEIKVLDKTPLPDRQKDFFSKKEENLETEAVLFSRLQQKIGQDKIFSAIPHHSYAPEKSWKKGSPSPSTASPAVDKGLPLRPLVLLSQAEPLKKIDSFLIYKNKKYQVKSWHGPERLVSDWWSAYFARQYWVVDLAENQRWWVYSDLTKPAAENLFLHGIYD
jgi:hypothetical protein